MEKTKLGIVEISYSKTGEASAVFIPEMDIKLDDSTIRNLTGIKSNDEEEVQKAADMVLSAWFTKLNEIELADRESYRITSEKIDCKKYDDNNIKQCIFRYYFEPIQITTPL